MGLREYNAKRDFEITPEPPGEEKATATGRSFVVQKHAATRLHYDFRLELDGVLLSWAVPKGPSLDPGDRRLAKRTEDHPIEYGTFEGIIPKGEYGGGTVVLWDRGEWEPLEDPHKGLARGNLVFVLHGAKMRGRYRLVQTRGSDQWLLIKGRDEAAKPGDGEWLVREQPQSVVSGRTLEDIARDPDRVWHGDRGDAEQAADPSAVAQAKKAKTLPASIAPQLATLADEAPDGDDWIHEIKHDGYRILARIERGEVKLVTRKDNDWTARLPAIARVLAELPVESAWLDGEIVVESRRGISDFGALQKALGHGGREADIRYFLFDLLFLDGCDLRGSPLIDRKELLHHVLQHAGALEGRIRYSDHVVGGGARFFAHACDLGIEGIVSKRADRPHTDKRTREWLKVKCIGREECIVGGFTEPSGAARSGIGALLLGQQIDGELRYIGKVGTGFDRATALMLRKKLEPLEIDQAAFVDPPRGYKTRGVHWVAPTVVAEIAFSEKTSDGKLRHPSFVGLREDKPATEVVPEAPASSGTGARPTRRAAAKRTGANDAAADATASDTDVQRTTAKKPSSKRTKAKKANANDADANDADANDTALRTTAMNTAATNTDAKNATAKNTALRTNAKDTASINTTASDDATKKKSRARRTTGVTVSGVLLSSPDRVLWRAPDVTKEDLARYYEAVAERVVPHVVDRPLTLVRCPEGFTGKADDPPPRQTGPRRGGCFYQKHGTASMPKGVRTLPIREKEKTEDNVWIPDLAGLIGLVQMGTLEVHTWGARVDAIEKPDRLVIDLDPGPGVPWSGVVEAAFEVRERLHELGLVSFVKTTGGKGLHVVFPVQRRGDWESCKEFCRALANDFVRRQPRRYVATMTKSKRDKKIFLDYFRNSRGSTSIAAYSTRAKPGAPVSTPLAWEELLEGIDPSEFTVHTVPQRLTIADPWAELGSIRQSITRAMRDALEG